MSNAPASHEGEEELLDYEEEEVPEQDAGAGAKSGTEKKGYVGIHATGFKELMLKPELLQAITDCGFEHPSEVQHECIPHAILGMDVLCQAKSGMGKTAVFVLSVLQQLDPKPGEVSAIVLCHTRELAYQICHEFERFSTRLRNVKVGNFFGGMPVQQQKESLKKEVPAIVVGTPGRIKQLAKEGILNLKTVKHFILDECDKVLEKLDMRADVQEIFKMTPHDKQVMMFSATLAQDIRGVCKKFMSNVRAKSTSQSQSPLSWEGCHAAATRQADGGVHARAGQAAASRCGSMHLLTGPSHACLVQPPMPATSGAQAQLIAAAQQFEPAACPAMADAAVVADCRGQYRTRSGFRAACCTMLLRPTQLLSVGRCVRAAPHAAAHQPAVECRRSRDG